jgi:DNA-directed RNA polymerase subunit K/omega
MEESKDSSNNNNTQNTNDIKKSFVIDNSKIYNTPLTKYEKTKIIGVRANAISNGSKPLIDTDSIIFSDRQLTEITIAEEEFRQKKFLYKIKRTIGNKTIEYNVEELTH